MNAFIRKNNNLTFITRHLKFASTTVFPQFPNTTGMTASVASSFSALANILLVYLSMCGDSHFYLSKDEKATLQTDLDSSVKYNDAKVALYQQKIKVAFDEVDRQLFPLLFFTLGAIAGVVASDTLVFKSLFFPIGILIFLVVEILLARRADKFYKSVKSSDPEYENPVHCSLNDELEANSNRTQLGTSLLASSENDSSDDLFRHSSVQEPSPRVIL